MSIQERAMLVQLTMGGFSGRRTARDIAREAAESHGADENALEATLRLIPASELQGIERASRECREYFDKNTLPWQRRGASILPCKLYFEFSQKLGQRLVARESEVDAFMALYEANAVSWVKRLNGLASGHILPTADIVRDRFKATVNFWPFPAGSDFRVDIEESELATLRESADMAAKLRIEEAVKDAVNRLRAVVRRYAENLGRTESGRARRLTDSMEIDLRELLDVLPAFNLTNSPALDAIVSECSALLSAPLATLRDNDDERARVQDEAQRIYDKMAGVWGNA